MIRKSFDDEKQKKKIDLIFILFLIVFSSTSYPANNSKAQVCSYLLQSLSAEQEQLITLGSQVTISNGLKSRNAFF